VSPDQIDAATNAVVSLTAAVDTYGPGIAVSVGAAVLAWTGRRIAARITRRRLENRDRDAAWQTQCAVDTEAGNDTDDLHTCLQILHATETARKEQP
jgi:hypothetical protein